MNNPVAVAPASEPVGQIEEATHLYPSDEAKSPAETKRLFKLQSSADVLRGSAPERVELERITTCALHLLASRTTRQHALELLVAIAPEEPYAAYAVAIEYERAGYPKVAEGLFAFVVERVATSLRLGLEARTRLAELHAREGRLAEAVTLWKQLARLSAEAAYNAGRAYEVGDISGELKQDRSRAMQLYRLAAAKDHLPATLALARLLADPQATDFEQEEANFWARQSRVLNARAGAARKARA